MDADGSEARALLPGAEPRWLQGDRWLSFLNFDSSSYRWRLYRFRLSDQRLEDVSARLRYDYLPLESQFSWSADGRRLIFAEYRTQRDLFQVVMQAGQTIQLTQNEQYDSHPGWSPDGNWIAFLSDGDIYVVRPDGSDLHALTDVGTFTNPLFWSLDGQALATVASPTLGQQLTTIDVTTGTVNYLTAPSLRVDPGKLAWSPDGAWIAFTTQNQALYRVAATGGEPALIKSGINFTPDWSPDGKWLVIVARDRDGNEDVYRITPDGRILERLFEAPPGIVARNPVWSPAVEMPYNSLPLLLGSLLGVILSLIPAKKL